MSNSRSSSARNSLLVAVCSLTFYASSSFASSNGHFDVCTGLPLPSTADQLSRVVDSTSRIIDGVGPFAEIAKYSNDRAAVEEMQRRAAVDILRQTQMSALVSGNDAEYDRSQLKIDEAPSESRGLLATQVMYYAHLHGHSTHGHDAVLRETKAYLESGASKYERGGAIMAMVVRYVVTGEKDQLNAKKEAVWPEWVMLLADIRQTADLVDQRFYAQGKNRFRKHRNRLLALMNANPGCVDSKSPIAGQVMQTLVNQYVRLAEVRERKEDSWLTPEETEESISLFLPTMMNMINSTSYPKWASLSHSSHSEYYDYRARTALTDQAKADFESIADRSRDWAEEVLQ